MIPSMNIPFVASEGTLTLEAFRLLTAMQSRFDALEAQLAAIAAVSAPVGGGTVDAEARTAIAAVIAGAG